MDYRRPFLAVAPTLDGDVLAALARGNLELSGRELARHVGHGSTEGIRRAAERLVAQGTVARRQAGGAYLYRLNRDHIAAPYIEGLATMPGQLIDRLRGLLAEWSQPPKVAMLFGSVARGQASAKSDIDVLVVRPRSVDPDGDAWRTQLLELQRSASAWTGNDTRVVEYGETELDGLQDEPLMTEVLADAVELYGSRRTLKRLLSSAEAA